MNRGLLAALVWVGLACGSGGRTTETTFDNPGTDGAFAGDGCQDRDRDSVPSYCARNAPAQLDCNDDDPSVHPGAEEICDDVDNDWSGAVDDGAGAPVCTLSCEKQENACDPAVELAT